MLHLWPERAAAPTRRRLGAVMPAPAWWPIFAQTWWGLTERDGTRLWEALASSRYTSVTSFRQQLTLGASGVGIDLEHMCTQTCSPAHVVEVLELLYHEGRLKRYEATRMQDQVLRLVDAAGQWR